MSGSWQRKKLQLSNVDHVPSNTHSFTENQFADMQTESIASIVGCHEFLEASDSAQACKSNQGNGRLGPFKDFDFAADLEDSKSTSGDPVEVEHLSLSVRNKRQFQTDRRNWKILVRSRDGIPALDHWDLVIEVLHSSSGGSSVTQQANPPTPKPKLKLSANVDYVSANVQSSRSHDVFFFEHQTMSHVSRTHRVARVQQ